MKNYYENEIKQYSSNAYIAYSEEKKEYKFELSIIVVAFNKLDYTKMCVESLLKHLPQDISYELILVNHGSSDGTKEYFESIHPDKQLDIKVNGGGLNAIVRIVEGKYTLITSNDVIIADHAIDNLYRCMESDESIAWAVSTTSNLCNFKCVMCHHGSEKSASLEKPYLNMDMKC